MKKFNLSRKKKIIIGIVVVLLIIVALFFLLTRGRSRLTTVKESSISKIAIHNNKSMEVKTFDFNDAKDLYNIMKNTKTSKGNAVEGMDVENYTILFYDKNDNEIDCVYINLSTRAVIIDENIIDSIDSFPYCEHFYSIDKEDGNKILTEIGNLTGWDTSWCMK